MSIHYSKRTEKMQPSIVRELLKLSADPGIISFAGGNPDAMLFPIAEIEKAGRRVLQADGGNALQYSVTEGNPGLRNLLAERMERLGMDLSGQQLMITSGSQQGIDLTGKLFIDEGDRIIVESPGYMGAINAFKFYHPTFIEAEMDGEGMDMEKLERTLKSVGQVKFIYTIPDFQNPTGLSMSEARRKQLVALAEKYETVIIEDSPYYDLRFRGRPIPPIKAFDRHGRVLYLGSISKILCPAMRIGWIVGEESIISKYVILKQAADLHTNELSQRQIGEFLRRNDFDSHITQLNASYRKKRDLMLKKLAEKFPSEVQYTKPDGGLFIWLTFPENWNANDFFELALREYGVAVVPGEPFYPAGDKSNTVRISYATMPLDRIEKGMNQLAGAVRAYSQRV